MTPLSISIVSKPQDYKIKKQHKYALSFFKFGVIIEKNDETIIQGELYDISNDKSYLGKVQKSYADIYDLQLKWPFLKTRFSLQKLFPI